MKNPVQKLRFVGILEGISFLLLLGVAMPLKYKFGIPEAVKYTGWVHGLLFIWLCLTLIKTMEATKMPFKCAVIVFFAALIPFGPFLIVGQMKKRMANYEPAQ